MEQGKNKLDWIPRILEDIILKQPKCLLNKMPSTVPALTLTSNS